ncbi:MAG: hypothetical protein EXR12_06720 [Rhodospirillaceae bacterium]|nr:hypothetical protein [Rhodospirillaceae bacterium]
MNEPTEPGAETDGAVTHVLPEIHFTPDGQHFVEPPEETEPPGDAPPAQGPHAEALPPVEPPAEEPPIERHDPFAYMRKAPWMDRRLSASGRAAVLLRRDLKAFPAVEGRDPNHADLDAIVKRTADYIVPIIRREQATDYVYEELEKRREARIALKRKATLTASPNLDPNIVLVGGPQAGENAIEVAQAPALPPRVESPSAETIAKSREGTPVILPNGKTVPNEYSRTRVLMSPFEDLKGVAEAGRETLKSLVANWLNDPLKVEEVFKSAVELTRKELGQGGRLDYQRLWIPDDSAPDYLQLPQFRDVSNFNVGLFTQQAWVPLETTLMIAGEYAKRHSSNYMADQRYGLDPRTRQWIERGYKIGKTGMFTSAGVESPSRPK